MEGVALQSLLAVISDDQAVRDLRSYFIGGTGSPPFTGARFEVLDGGGSRDDVRDRITPWDILAVQCLSVTVPAAVAVDLIDGVLGRQLGALLHDIPTNVALGDADASIHVSDRSSADQAWRLLDAQDDVGWVIAGKVMARKRPHLIPVWDKVVRCAFGRPRNAWLWLDDLLRQQDSELKTRLDELHRAAELPDSISRIRVLDVVIWMRHRPSHRSVQCPGLAIPRAESEG